MKRDFLMACLMGIFMMAALVLGRSIQDILIVLLIALLLWLLKGNDEEKDDGGSAV